MVCNIDIREPKTLKEALELLDVLHKSVGGATRGIKNVLKNKLGTEKTAAFNNLQSALTNACELRAGIVGYNNVRKYGKYNNLEHSGDDEACGFRIISILKILLPKLITTLTFLLKKVGLIDDAHWGGQRCDGESIYGAYHVSGYGGKELHLWLIDRIPDPSDSLKRGYGGHWLSPQTGNGLKGSLQALVGPQTRCLQKLEEHLKDIPTHAPSQYGHPSPPAHPHRSPGAASSPRGPPAYRRSPSAGLHEHGYQSHQSRVPSVERGDEYIPSSKGSQGPQRPPPPPPRSPQPRLPMHRSPRGGSPERHTNDHSSDRADSGTSYEHHKYGTDSQPGSTAAIGGAVGATGLVGGGAAVYFLNVGGIRTLIAG
ncbi:uncharacterized protein BcabD6B2_09680 [Babesia caballi]|uniref:Uncharacterized protein n=1 Tax=Babesia caballi TaxID=5871 RepID=A0AAV4LP59_BABCB|nr:hypothetical protein BcabD6B2_09680 [Babesia caballi]